MGVSVWSGGARIVGAGQVTAFRGRPLVFRVEHGELTVELGFVFHTDPEVPDVAVELEHQEAGVVLHLTNFDGTEGRGTSEPMLLAASEGRELYVHFRVFRYGNTKDRTVHYTFFVERVGP